MFVTFYKIDKNKKNAIPKKNSVFVITTLDQNLNFPFFIFE